MPQVPVIPITLVGTGDLMPNAKEYLLYPGKVTVSASVAEVCWWPAGWLACWLCRAVLPAQAAGVRRQQLGIWPGYSVQLCPLPLLCAPPASPAARRPAAACRW